MARTLTTVGAPSGRLAAALAGFDDARLAGLLQARPDLATPAPSDFARLADRAWTWPSVYACYRGLDAWCQQVVQALCLLPVPTTVDELAALLGLAPGHGDVSNAVDLLADRALVLRTGPAGAVELADPMLQMPYPAGLGPSARVVLGRQTAGQLAAIARHHGVAAASGSKAVTLEAVAAALADPATIAEAIRSGPPGTAELVRRFADEGPVGVVPGGLYGSALSDRTATGWLVNRGLLAAESWNTAVMPGEVGLALRGGRPFPDLANTRPALHPVAIGTATVDAGAAESALRLVADVTALLEDWSAVPPKLLKAGGLGIREVRRAAKVVDRSDMEAGRIVDLAAAAGLIVADHFSESALPTAAYDDWLALDAPARWQALVAAWLASPLHLGLAGEIGTKDKPIPPLLHRFPEAEARRRRAAVLAALVSAPEGEAVTEADLHARLRWEGPLLWSGGPGSAPMMVEWVVEEAELLGLAARRALSTVGRLAATGRLDEAASILAASAPPVSSTFVVQADLTVVAPGELAAPVRAELELLADVESKGAATVFRLSEASLRRGLDGGRTPEEILAFLEDHAIRDVPQSLRYLVTDLGRRFGQVRVGAARCYVRSDDPSLLAEVTRSRGTARLKLRLLAPTVAVTDAKPETVLEALRDAGHLPAQEDDDGSIVLVRRERHRASARPQPVRPAAPATTDVASVVARLRAAPPPPPPKLPANASARPTPPPPPPQSALFETTARPMEIFKDREEVEGLLAQAFVEDWVVRVAYTNSKGRSTQLNVVLLAPPDDEALVEVLPDGSGRNLVLDRIEWARVLTEAEEDRLY